MFGVLFPNRSFPLDITTFTQVDDHRWILDMNYFVGKKSLTLSRDLFCIHGRRKWNHSSDPPISSPSSSSSSHCCGDFSAEFSENR